MDPLILARLQFAITTVYHFFFVPLTLGLSVMVAIMETIYVRTGNKVYKDMTKFWGKLFLINFAMGVATGIVQEFQFGMNWSQYSRFVGDIFGAPLAIEALLAFFLESTFLGIWIFGWDKLSKGAHAAVIWVVAIGANLSAVWILIANAFMQQPTGYVIQNGRAEMANFLQVITNPTAMLSIPHTIAAGFTTAAFFVLGISAYHLLRKKDVEAFHLSFKLASIVGTLAIVVVILVGHSQAQHMVRTQPMKMASAEALWKTEDPASFSLLSIWDLNQEEIFSIRIPFVLSFLSYNRFSGEVKGINDLQAESEAKYGSGSYIPPLFITYWSFRLMVGAGFLMAGLGIIALYLAFRKRLAATPRLIKIFPWAMVLPYLANTTGWLLTEFGRFPWVVYGLMRLESAVSNTVPAIQVMISLLGFTLLYAALIVADIYLMAKFAKAGIPESGSDEPVDEPIPSLSGAQD